jgi:hypothetical protein
MPSPTFRKDIACGVMRGARTDSRGNFPPPANYGIFDPRDAAIAIISCNVSSRLRHQSHGRLMVCRLVTRCVRTSGRPLGDALHIFSTAGQVYVDWDASANALSDDTEIFVESLAAVEPALVAGEARRQLHVDPLDPQSS